MVTSIDGKATGDFLFGPRCAEATEIYYRINREQKADGFICGRITMEGSFTGGWYPDLSKYIAVHHKHGKKIDFITDNLCGFYAIAFDTYGKLGWKSNKIIDPDGDPGYDGAQIIEVLSEDVDERYLGYLEAMEIPYIFAGEKSIDVKRALLKLKDLFGCKTLLLEGGSILNGAFERAGVIDELSLVVAPVIAGKGSKPLFTDADISSFELTEAENENGNLVFEETFEYTYGDDGFPLRTIQSTRFDDGSTFRMESDEMGNRVFETQIDADGAVVYAFDYSYEYDENGRMLREIISEDGRITYETLYAYSDDPDDFWGYQCMTIDYFENGSKTVCELDEFGDIISETSYNADGNIIS